MGKVEKPCFSNGSSFEWWTERNCDNCIKASRRKSLDYEAYTKGRCEMQREIMNQYLGYGNEPVREKTYDATQGKDCPYRVAHYPKRRKRDRDKSLTLQFDRQ